MTIRNLVLRSALLVAASVPFTAHADSALGYDFQSLYYAASPDSFGTAVGSGGSLAYYMDATRTGNGVGVTISGWNASSNASPFYNKSTNLVMYSGGIGLNMNEANPLHAFDNNTGLDLLILKFDQAVALNQVDMGWYSTDSDFTLLAYTGFGAPVLDSDLDSAKFEYDPTDVSTPSVGMTNLGWSLIGHYDADNDGISSSDPLATSVNAGNVVSSYWAIGAYTSAIVDASKTFGYVDQGNDYFKIRAVAATLVDGGGGGGGNPVPLPATAGLLALALGLSRLLTPRTRTPAEA